MAKTRLVRIVNRTTMPLDVMYDGAPDVIPPGYAEVDDPDRPGEKRIVGAADDGLPLGYPCEYFAAEAYKRQHPLMGSQDPNSVDARDTEYLLGVAEWGDEVTPLEQSGADELIDRKLLPQHRQNATLVSFASGGVTRDARDRKARKDARKAKTKERARNQENRRSKFSDPMLFAPSGIRASYNRPGEG
jgi:hypothetical protein